MCFVGGGRRGGAMSNSLFFPFTDGFGFEELLGGGGRAGPLDPAMHFTSFSSTFGSTPHSGMSKRTSTSTRFINGKKITTKK